MLPTTQSTDPERIASQSTDPAWIASQNERTDAWLSSPAHLLMRKQMQQRLTQQFATLHQPQSPAAAVSTLDREWLATVTNNPATDLQNWQLWQGTAASSQPREVVTDVYPTGIAWLPDRSGFYYDRYLAYPGAHALYFHRVGTSQRQDRCVFYHGEQPAWHYQPTVSPDGRWLAITILNHTANNRLTLMPLSAQLDEAEGTAVASIPHAIVPHAIVPHFSGRYDILHWQPDRLILRAIEPHLPQGRLCVVDLETLAEIRSSFPQAELPLVDAVPVGKGWVMHYLQGGCAELQLCDAHGKAQTTVPLPGLGSVLWLEASTDATTHATIHATTDASDDLPQVRYCYTDHSRPPQVYCWQPGDCESKHLGEPYRLPYDPADFVTRQAWVPSADGTLVPLVLTQRRDLPSQPCPTLLTAYGGLGHTHTPQFTTDGLVWLALGGIYATLCARGGDELGAGWHQAAVGLHKQRTFDDVLAAARWLIEQGITTPSQLGVWGVSNGGLTAGACLTQAPALFGAVVIDSGLLDMLDYPTLGRGADWLAEYGAPTDPAMRPVLAAYSPLHTLHRGRSYPATLITTHEHDPRVGEAHSLRFAQALQAAQGGAAPILLRVDPGSGHAGPATHAEQVASATGRLTFLAVNLGLQP